MTDKKPPQTAQDVLRELHEFLLGPEPDFASMPIEQVREYLTESGVDPKPTIQAIHKRIAKARGERALKAAREKRQQWQRRLAGTGAAMRDVVSMGRNELVAFLQELTGPQEAAVFMHKYEELDEDDLRSIIEDMLALGEHDDAGG